MSESAPDFLGHRVHKFSKSCLLLLHPHLYPLRQKAHLHPHLLPLLCLHFRNQLSTRILLGCLPSPIICLPLALPGFDRLCADLSTYWSLDMASLACSRLGGPCIGSLGCLEPLDAVAVLKPPECPSPRLWSICTVNDRLLGNVSGTAGVEGLRFAAGAHDGGASVCVFQETAQLLQRSEAVRRNHHNLSAAQWPAAINKTQGESVGEEASALHVDGTASMAFLSLSSNAHGISSDAPSDASPDASPSSQRVEGPLDRMTALGEALPVKRGLSRHFAGKSQSFSCLADVRSVADLAKPLNPFVKRRKTNSYLEKEACYRSLPTPSISKRPVNSHRKAHPVLTVPKSAAPEIVYTMPTDSLSTSVPLKCFSSPELGERTLSCF